MNRLIYLMLAVGVATAAQAAGGRLDPDKPRDAIKIRQKFTCSLNEGEKTIGWWQGSFYSRVEGEKDRELFKVVGVNVRQCKNYDDPERGPGFRSTPAAASRITSSAPAGGSRPAPSFARTMGSSRRGRAASTA